MGDPNFPEVVARRLDLVRGRQPDEARMRFYIDARAKLFAAVPRLGAAYSMMSIDTKLDPATRELALHNMEHFCFNFLWLQRFQADSGCVDECRQAIDKLAGQLLDSGEFWLAEPEVVIAMLLSILQVEWTALGKGLKGTFGNKEKKTMVESLIRELQGVVRPADFERRLHILEGQGIFFSSRAFDLVKLAEKVQKPRP